MRTALHSLPITKDSRFIDKVCYIVQFYYDYIVRANANPYCLQPQENLSERNNLCCEVIGPLVDDRYYDVFDREQLKHAYFSNDLPTILVSNGSLGGEFTTKVAHDIVNRIQSKINLIVVCGRNPKIREDVEKLQDSSRSINIRTFTYTDRFPEFGN